MNYRNILGSGLLVFSAFALQPAHAFSIKTGMKGFQVTNSSSSIPGSHELKPIRKAKGRFQVIRTVVEFDPQTGHSNVKRDTVCMINADVAVYDARQDSGMINSTSGECMDHYQGDDIRIGLDADILYTNQSMFGEPPQDYKNFTAIAFAIYTKGGGGKELPKIPFQSSFTKDLNQTSFGLVSSPVQMIQCDSLSIGEDHKLEDGKNCTVINPIAYQIIWEVEDRP